MGQYQSGPLMCCAIVARFYEQLALFPVGILFAARSSE